MKWATFIGTLVGAAVVAAAGAARPPGPAPMPAHAGADVPAVISQVQWAEMNARLKLLDERTARIESILMEGRR